AWVVGRMLEGEDSPSWARIGVAFALGSTVIYLLGLAQLSLWLHCSLKQAFLLGVLPFLPGDLAKLALASLLYRRGSRTGFAISH
ncbi:MAG: biotin transporter BioY, partial [candidate division NC10 bacterium]|nr:biotin transporter BioY [candidate division NC10 bacterium]